MMHLHGRDGLDHDSVIFDYPEIGAGLELGHGFRGFLETLEDTHDLDGMVDREVREKVFGQEGLDNYYAFLQGEKDGEAFKGYTKDRRLEGVSDRQRQEFNQHFQEYIRKHGRHQPTEEKKQEETTREKKREKKNGRGNNTLEQDRHQLLKSIVGHHTGLAIESHDANATLHISQQILDHALGNDYALLDKSHYTLHPNDSVSFIQVNSSMSFKDKKILITDGPVPEEEDPPPPPAPKGSCAAAKGAKKEKMAVVIPALKAKLLKVPEIANPLVPLMAFPLSIPIAIIKGIITLILSIVGKIMHICLPFGPLCLPSCPEAMGSFANIYAVFQFEEKNKIILA